MNITLNLENFNLKNEKYLIVGVSAGPDSMALLHLLKTSTKKKLVCAHINHHIRPISDEEEKYLKNYCQNNNIIFETMKITSYHENNFENEARTIRYNFYEQILKKYQSHTLFLAHHGDDLIETVFMKIIRGSNLEGYAGIKLISLQKDYQIIRPLLSYTKQDLIKYNQNHNLKYYLDETNDDTTYTRNRYRKKILPILKDEDPMIHHKFKKYSETLSEYYNYIEQVIIEKLPIICPNNKINLTKFKSEHPFIQKNLIFYYLSNIYNNQSNIIKDKHLHSIINLINSKKPNGEITLPKNYVAIKEYNQLFINHKQSPKSYKILLTDNLKIDDITFNFKKKCDTDGNNVCRLNSESIKLPLYLRNKKNGDKIETKGLHGHKKLKEIFIENKIPPSTRKTYPILVDENDTILWIPNIKKSKYNVKKTDICDIIIYSHKEREDINENKK